MVDIGKRKADDSDYQYLIACGLIYGLLHHRFTDHSHQHRNVFFKGILHRHNDNYGYAVSTGKLRLSFNLLLIF
ncbi:hypothetical protein QMA77_17105 [Pantoea ananatis]|uniref:hypothetical protein n=1 Tax=Pantoea ananas TaxID=553 RepID=UPI0024ADBD19|nr:hypothetical protein [Pantoea ananatis]MDI6538644.1 hypothetical protein [Pantoea ananatis]